VAPLRALLDPVATLNEVVNAAAGSEVQAVVLFGSIVRGEASAASDIDLAVIAPNGWDRRVEMADAVRTRLGNDCDVLVFTPTEFVERARGGEPVVSDILRRCWQAFLRRFDLKHTAVQAGARLDRTEGP
jgi:predicted nucleotidyltransferase